MKIVFFCKNTSDMDRHILVLRLKWPNLRPLLATDEQVGLRLVDRENPDLVIIYEGVSDASRLVRLIREFSDVPITVAAEGGDEIDVVKALESGADDYIHLPCDLMIFMARIVALLRRVEMTRKKAFDNPQIVCGQLLINPSTFEAYMGTRRIPLTPTEFELLHLLMRNRHMTVSQDFVSTVIWCDGIGVSDKIKKYIQRLRYKLGDDAKDPRWIRTIHGVGYRFIEPETVVVEEALPKVVSFG